MANPRIDYFDNRNSFSGNGGYISLSPQGAYSPSDPLNICKWSLKFENIVARFAGSGGNGFIRYRTIAQTAYIHVELMMDFTEKDEQLAGQLKLSSFDPTSNVFSFKGLLSDSINTNGQQYAYQCSEVEITDLLIVSSQQADDVVRIIIEGVASTAVQKV